MKFIYDLIAGNSRVTPLGVAIAAVLSWYVARTAFSPFAGALFIALLITTLFLGVLEKER